jgi:hypothetical protein
MSVVYAMATWASPAVAHEFFGDSPFRLAGLSNVAQEFQLGSSDSLKCEKLEVEYSPASHSTQLALAIVKYEECKYTHSGTVESVGVGVNGCEYLLKSTSLIETSANNFDEGTLGIECSAVLAFETAHCGIQFPAQSPLSEFRWKNTNTASGLYASELFFRLSHITYKIIGTGCGSSGTNGEYHGTVELGGVIVK